ncbi:MAG: hypothetical protein A2252_00760 [Elusimicrobia bacterium RIFOXYA2_FULL_39_19]|nr:MAG: hypothetical protein A2252_00760 [Elusimicrobia bacterium RIFOXYA2_FULL_39_19]
MNNNIIEKFSKTAGFLYRHGWAEANAGNISLRLDDAKGFKSGKNAKDVFTMPVSFPELDGCYFMITATGSRMRDIMDYAQENIGLIKITDKGKKYTRLWGRAPATSELPAHLMVHKTAVKDKPQYRAVIHTHPANLIVMSSLKKFQDEKNLNNALMRVHPETKIKLPRGFAVLPYIIPGSVELGDMTARALMKRDLVFWSMHGVVSFAENLENALDIIEVAEKAAQLYMMKCQFNDDIIRLEDKQMKSTLDCFGIKFEI